MEEATKRGVVTYDEAKKETIKLVEAEFEKYREHFKDVTGVVVVFKLKLVDNKGDIHNINPRNYKEYFDWRTEVFTRDGFVCRNCGSEKKIEAHHIKQYEFHPELRASLDNGITLCHECHKKIPRKRR